MRSVLTALMLLILGLVPAFAQQDPVPERRLVVTRDVDFYGADLQALFETTLEACQRVCLNDASLSGLHLQHPLARLFPEIVDQRPATL